MTEIEAAHRPGKPPQRPVNEAGHWKGREGLMNWRTTKMAAKIERTEVRPVIVPFLTKTAAGDITQAPLVLVDLTTDEGVTGRSYIFTYTSLALKPVCELIEGLAELLVGKEAAPTSVETFLTTRMRLLGDTGLIRMAISAIEMACWDALARSQSLPLATLLGGALAPTKCYLSVGMDDGYGAARAAESALQRGFGALKLKIGFPDFADDLGAVDGALKVLGGHAGLMVDYNQSLTVSEAMRRCEVLDDKGLIWIEEPTLQDDYEGHAKIAAAVRTPIQLGENWYGAREMSRCVLQQSADFAMVDLMKIGGVAGWMRAARLAEAAGLQLSSHIFQEVSAQLMCVTPTAHWIEYVNMADPILAEPAIVSEGKIVVSQKPGSGLDWDEKAVAKYGA
jgi:mandelate racemase